MRASRRRLFWVAWTSTVIAMLVEHVIWFLARSQSMAQAVEFVSVPLLMGLVGGALAGGLAVAAGAVTRRKPAVLRYPVVAVFAALGALLGTVFFPAMFLYKGFTVAVIATIVAAGMLLFARDSRPDTLQSSEQAEGPGPSE